MQMQNGKWCFYELLQWIQTKGYAQEKETRDENINVLVTKGSNKRNKI